jgi:hypothetical protein
MRLRTPAALAVLPLALILSLTACGSDDDGGKGKVASAGGAGQGGASSSPSLSRDEMTVKFTECLRKNGVPMPDPAPGKPLQFKFDQNSGVSQATVQKAMEACRQYNPMQNMSPKEDAQAADRSRKFAECMRKNGVEAFPDPKPGQGGIRIDGKVGNDPDFEKAQQTCQDIMSGTGAKQ